MLTAMRDLTTSVPKRVWLADITEHRTTEGALYLCDNRDVFSNRSVGHPIDSRIRCRIALKALNNAVALRGDVGGCTVHTYRGSHFRSSKHIRALNRHDMVG